jgi:hypothetical protein
MKSARGTPYLRTYPAASRLTLPSSAPATTVPPA